MAGSKSILECILWNVGRGLERCLFGGYELFRRILEIRIFRISRFYSFEYLLVLLIFSLSIPNNYKLIFSFQRCSYFDATCRQRILTSKISKELEFTGALANRAF